MGKDFWQPLIEFMQESFLGQETISQADFNRIILTDSAEEAVKIISECATRKFGVRWQERRDPIWWLLEQAHRKLTTEGTYRAK